uniref:Uncharacterized protein n=1 Tax=Physcomitrium patens TaxID=3218 RepID=A0A7I3Z6G3_PHYPA
MCGQAVAIMDGSVSAIMQSHRGISHAYYPSGKFNFRNALFISSCDRQLNLCARFIILTQFLQLHHFLIPTVYYPILLRSSNIM